MIRKREVNDLLNKATAAVTAATAELERAKSDARYWEARYWGTLDRAAADLERERAQKISAALPKPVELGAPEIEVEIDDRPIQFVGFGARPKPTLRQAAEKYLQDILEGDKGEDVYRDLPLIDAALDILKTIPATTTPMRSQLGGNVTYLPE